MGKYIIYCDESIQKGTRYSNFYGGVILKESEYTYIVKELEKVKNEIDIKGEMKWTNVSLSYLDKYILFIDKYFDLIEKEYLKMRVMFRHELFLPSNLTEEQEKKGYHLLYYQFIKNAFGIMNCLHKEKQIDLIIYFDKLPKTKVLNDEFKDFIYNLQFCRGFNHLNILKEDMSDIDSKNHIILQGMDIILGSIQYKMNVIDCNIGTKGNKYLAKLSLYDHIFNRIKKLHDNFEFEIYKNTPIFGCRRNSWDYKYSHWDFRPSNAKLNIDYISISK